MGVESLTRYSSGISGLDALLRGGFVAERIYLLVGGPGTGKTLLGTEFLSAGLDAGENVLFIHGEESREDLAINAEQLGIDLDGADFLDLGPESAFFAEERSYDLVNPQDVESEGVIDDIREAVEEVDPNRVLIDPISQLQYVESSEYQFRKRMIAFIRFLKDRGTTVLVTKTDSGREADQLMSLSDGVVTLRHGETGRRIDVIKHRGIGQRDGAHGMAIREDGVEVFPSLVPEDHESKFDPTQIRSGISELDTLLGGGFERGTVTIISGPTGVGKTTTSTEFLEATASAGDSAIAYLFEESIDTFVHRSETFGIPVTELGERGTLSVESVDPLTLSPEEFAQRVKAQVKREDANLVVIDGIDGYRTSIHGEERMLARKLHALTRYLKNENVAVILIDEIGQVTGIRSPTSSNISYLADNILFMNYIELDGRLKRVAGVLKKRVGNFEDTLRKFAITDDGIAVGAPITDVQGVLNGTPEWVSGETRSDESDEFRSGG
jgi:circadian clock protein KaiC